MIKNDIISIERCWYIVDHLVYSPRVWRWSRRRSPFYDSQGVFSTSVEVIPMNCNYSATVNCILHECGGDPMEDYKIQQELGYSPRVWRWSFLAPFVYKFLWVFSTSVEVILRELHKGKQVYGILHECGGDPVAAFKLRIIILYSPRVWRWSHTSRWLYVYLPVFSTSVEVILKIDENLSELEGILHECGGDPDPFAYLLKMLRVFSTSVEVIPYT